MPDNRSALETYEAWSDQDLKDFVATYLPQHLWRVEKRPRCAFIREIIFRELNNRGGYNGQRAMNLENF